MFKKLRLQLTIYNTIILILFLLIFGSVIFMFMSRTLFIRTDRGLRLTANRVESLTSIPPNPFERRGLLPQEGGQITEVRDNDSMRYSETHFILRDQGLSVTAADVRDSLVVTKTLNYAEKVIEAQKPSYVIVEANGDKLRLLTMPFNKNGQQGIVQVYTNINREIAFLSHLITALFGIGLVSIVILAAIGWVLGGKSLGPIKKSWQQQKDFVADASHELRTPLAVIGTNLEVLYGNQQQTIAENIHWLDNIRSETEVMSKLVNDLLLLTRMDAKQIRVEKIELNFSKLVAETITGMQLLFNSQEIELNQQIAGGITIMGDRLRLKQLLHILLDNSLKYTPRGGKVNVTLDSDHEKIELSFQDTGIGIDRQDQQRIFDRFYRVDKARSRSQGGTGLGLNIAHWIVEEHHGKIRIESEIDKGSSFVVTFPNS